jgi:hypothetical protein
MNDLFFWLQWKSSYKALYVALLFLFFATVIASGIAYTYGDIYTMGWDSTGEWKTVALGLDTFTVNQFEIPQESEQFLLFKRYTSNNVTIHPWISYTFLSTVLIAFVCFLVVISYLELWLYIVGMALFLFFIVSMNTELVGLLGIYNRLPTVVVILIFGGLTYYFNAYGKNIGLLTRISIIGGSTAAFILSIVFASDVAMPLLYISNYALPIPIIISIIFMAIVGYDIIQLLVVLTSYGKTEYKTKGNSIWSFIILGMVYLANLYLVFYKPAFIKEYGIVLLQPLVVLGISGILGIWLFEMKKENQSAIPFKPLGAILYLALGIITFSTIAFGYATANDALITTLETAALYIEIGMGLGVFIYIITNFWTKYKNQEPVYKQFYITYQVPFFVARSLGWAIVMYFVFSSNRFVFSSSKAAYYNNIADIYLYTEQDELAESFYKEAWSHEFQNQRSSYTLGNFYELRDKKSQAFEFYQNCLTKNTSVYSFASLSTFYINNNQLFPAIFMLQDGLEKYPNDPHLLNNLGYLYTKTDNTDSAAYFFNKAAKFIDDGMPASNLLVYFGTQAKFAECDAIIKNEKNKTSDTYLANKIGIETLQGKLASAELPDRYLSDTLLTPDAFTYLYNYTINKLAQKDTLLDYTLQRYSSYPDNDFYKANLLYAKALHLYFSQTNVAEALTIMQHIVAEKSQPLYVITLANWQLKSGLYEQAFNTYRLIITHPDQRLVLYKCIAAMEYGNTADASIFIDELTKSLTPQVASIATTLKAALSKPSIASYHSLSDQQKVQCLHYQHLSTPEFILYKNTIQDVEQSIILDLQRIQLLIDQNEYETAMSVWNAMNKSDEISEEIIADATLEKLRIIAGLKQWDLLTSELKSARLRTQNIGYLDYFNARILEHSKDSLRAGEFYKQATLKIGYTTEVQLAYAHYLETTIGDIEAAEQLVRAKEIISFSKPLSLAYIDICLRLGLFKSAEDELNLIDSKLTATEAASIRSKFYAAPQF